MIARRFVLDLVVPRTLADDDEALQTFGSMMWHEMLERAGGVPDPEPMIRTLIGTLPMAEGDLPLVPIHIIGYAVPAVEVRNIDRREPIVLENTFEGGTEGNGFDSVTIGGPNIRYNSEPLMRDASGEINGIFDYNSTISRLFGVDLPMGDVQERDEYYYRGYTEEDLQTTPQEETWSDAMRWTPGDGKGEL